MINLFTKTVPLFLKNTPHPKFSPLPFKKFTPQFSLQTNSSKKPYQWHQIMPQTPTAVLTKPLIHYPRWLFATRLNPSFLLTQRPFILPTGNHLINFNLFSIFNYKSIDQGDGARKNHKIKMDAILKREPEYRTIEEKIELFNYLLESGEEEIKKAYNKDIVIVFGKTGSGKSTLINYLYGCKMIKDDNDNIVVSPDSEVKEVARIGTEISSCTYLPKQIPDITIASRKKFQIDNNSEVIVNSETLTLYDMPGLDDNRGVEVALANAIVIKELTERANSVRFVMTFEHGLITGERGNEWKEAVKLLTETFGGSVGKTPDSLCLIVTKPTSGIETIVNQIKKCNGPNGTSVDLSQHVTIYDPLNPSKKGPLLDLIYEKTPFQSLSTKVTVGHEQLSRAIDLGEEVQKSVEKHLQSKPKGEAKTELDFAVKKIQFTYGIAKLGNPKLERPHKEASKAVCEFVEKLLRDMRPELSSELVTKQIETLEKFNYTRSLFDKYIKFENFNERLHELKDRIKDPRIIAWDKPETSIGASLTTLCCIAVAVSTPVTASAAALAVAAGAGIGAVVGAGATIKGICNWFSPSEKDKKITAFFKSL